MNFGISWRRQSSGEMADGVGVLILVRPSLGLGAASGLRSDLSLLEIEKFQDKATTGDGNEDDEDDIDEAAEL